MNATREAGATCMFTTAQTPQSSTDSTTTGSTKVTRLIPPARTAVSS